MKAKNIAQVQNYVSEELDIAFNNLTSMEGCPEKIDGYLNCSDNLLTSFEHFPKHIDGDLYMNYNKFTSFKDIDQHIHYIGDGLSAISNDITSGFSDLFGIDGLTMIWVDNTEIKYIVNRWLPTKNIIEFQDEMIKAGYESYL